VTTQAILMHHTSFTHLTTVSETIPLIDFG